jgi:hypothetical protein
MAICRHRARMRDRRLSYHETRSPGWGDIRGRCPTCIVPPALSPSPWAMAGRVNARKSPERVIQRGLFLRRPGRGNLLHQGVPRLRLLLTDAGDRCLEARVVRGRAGIFCKHPPQELASRLLRLWHPAPAAEAVPLLHGCAAPRAGRQLRGGRGGDVCLIEDCPDRLCNFRLIVLQGFAGVVALVVRSGRFRRSPGTPRPPKQWFQI